MDSEGRLSLEANTTLKLLEDCRVLDTVQVAATNLNMYSRYHRHAGSLLLITRNGYFI